MKLRILVIDDEQCIRDTFKWHLEDLGHEVLTAPEPVACSIYHGHVCNESTPCGDLLFIDYQMPTMTGLEFIQFMRESGCKGSPANKYIISGNTAQIDMGIVEKLGCHVLQKPVDLEHIDRIIEKTKEGLDQNRQLTELSTLTEKTKSYRSPFNQTA